MKPKKIQLKKEYDIPLNPFGKLFKYLHDIITARTIEFQYDNKTVTIFIIVSFDTFKYPIPHQPVRAITELRHAIDSDHDIAQLAHMIHYYMDTNNIPTIN